MGALTLIIRQNGHNKLHMKWKSTGVFLRLSYASVKRLLCNLISITEKFLYLFLCNMSDTRN